MNFTAEIWLAVIGATVGALLGSLTSILFGLIASRQQQRRDLVLDLYNEYNSAAMMGDRVLTSDFFRNRLRGTDYYDYRIEFADPARQGFAGVNREQFEAFRRLSIWFEKVHMFKENRYLSRRLASRMIGIYVCGWARNGWLDFLADSTKDTSEAFVYRKQHFTELYEWFQCDSQVGADRDINSK